MLRVFQKAIKFQVPDNTTSGMDREVFTCRHPNTVNLRGIEVNGRMNYLH
jgi:hypothetical protein